MQKIAGREAAPNTAALLDGDGLVLYGGTWNAFKNFSHGRRGAPASNNNVGPTRASRRRDVDFVSESAALGWTRASRRRDVDFVSESAALGWTRVSRRRDVDFVSESAASG